MHFAVACGFCIIIPLLHWNLHHLFGHVALVFISRLFVFVRCLFEDGQAAEFTPHQLAFAYVANKMQPGLLGDYRSVELIESAYACVAAKNVSNAACASKL